MEYRGAAITACEAVWLKRILKDLGVPIKDPTSPYCDNMSNIYLARNPVFHARTKHIKVHYHFIRERVLAGDVDLQHISTNLQTADIFTKDLGADKLWKFMTDLGLTIPDLSSLRGSTEDIRNNTWIPQPHNKAAKKDTSQSTDFATTHNASWTTDSATLHKCESTRTPKRESKRISDTV